MKYRAACTIEIGLKEIEGLGVWGRGRCGSGSRGRYGGRGKNAATVFAYPTNQRIGGPIH